MKRTIALKKTCLILAIGFVIVASTGIYTHATNAGPELSEISIDQAEQTQIVINNNTELDLFCAGNGTDGLTPATAHVINGTTIDAGWNGTCIRITNVSRYLVLWNITVSRAGYSEDYPEDAGILLKSCSNILVNACVAVRNEVGIWFQNCQDCVIANSTADMNLYSGIYLKNTGGVNVTGNILRKNHCYGIKMESTTIGTNIINNTITDTVFNRRVQPTAPGTGIYAYYSMNATIVGNNITGSGTYGIALDYSDYCVISTNTFIDCYQDCIDDWGGTGNQISSNLCIAPFPWVTLALLIPIVLALVLVIASIALVQSGKKRRAEQGTTWKPISPGRVTFGSVALLVGLSIWTFLIPLSMKDYIERDVTYHEIIMLWGIISDVNPQNQLEIMQSPAIFSYAVGMGLLLVCIVYLLVKRSNIVKDKVTSAKALTVPLWCLTSLAAILTSFSIFPYVRTLNPTIVPIDIFLLNAAWLLCCIAGLIFSWRVRVGPWLVGPSSWEDLSKRNEIFRECVYKVKNLLDIGKEGVISIDVVAVTWNCATAEAKRQIKDLLIHKYIDGRFLERGTTFLLLGVNLPFILESTE